MKRRKTHRQIVKDDNASAKSLIALALIAVICAVAYALAGGFDQ